MTKNGIAIQSSARPGGMYEELNVSLVERYTDRIEPSRGLIQGQRFDIISGKPFFRAAARQDERTDITLEITAAAARELNTLKGEQYQAARDHFLSTKEMRLQGDPSSMGARLEAVHDPIVERAS